jgi:WD40 repeat protein
VIPGFREHVLRSLVVTPHQTVIGASFSSRMVVLSLKTGEELSFYDAPGGAIWCLALNTAGDTLAAAFDDGTIRLFTVSNNSIDYFRTLERFPGM